MAEIFNFSAFGKEKKEQKSLSYVKFHKRQNDRNTTYVEILWRIVEIIVKKLKLKS